MPEGPRFQPFTTLDKLQQATAICASTPFVAEAVARCAGGRTVEGEIVVVFDGITTAVPASVTVDRPDELFVVVG